MGWSSVRSAGSLAMCGECAHFPWRRQRSSASNRTSPTLKRRCLFPDGRRNADVPVASSRMMICQVTASISPAGPSPNPGWTAGCARPSGSVPEDSAATAFRGHMLCEMARTSCDGGLVMSLQCGVRRDHHTATAARFGPDVGVDTPSNSRSPRRCARCWSAMALIRDSTWSSSPSTRQSGPASSHT
jgi:hypothetical protein